MRQRPTYLRFPPARPDSQLFAHPCPLPPLQFLALESIAAVPQNVAALAREHKMCSILFCDIVSAAHVCMGLCVYVRTHVCAGVRVRVRVRM